MKQTVKDMNNDSCKEQKEMELPKNGQLLQTNRMVEEKVFLFRSLQAVNYSFIYTQTKHVMGNRFERLSFCPHNRLI